MTFNIVDFNSVNTIIDLVLGILVIAFAIFVCVKITRNKTSIIICAVSSLCVVICWVLNLELTFFIIFGLFIAYLIATVLNNFSKVRSILTANKDHNISKTNNQKKGQVSEKIFDRQATYKKLYDTVAICSKQKIGALITFEKNDSLENIARTGTFINAPMSSELLMTIFYPGTRLHDGAVVVRNDMIVAASVYYTPTTRPLTGKYGSRHRAAIGISEICDAVTVVVSEETGRISIAHDSEIEPVSIDNFLREFEDAMLTTSKK